jgi:hypothetical protein
VQARAGQTTPACAERVERLGPAEDALPLARDAVRACQEGRSERESGQALMVLARVLSTLDRPAEALACLQDAHRLFVALELPEARTAAAQLAAGGPDLSAY